MAGKSIDLGPERTRILKSAISGCDIEKHWATILYVICLLELLGQKMEEGR